VREMESLRRGKYSRDGLHSLIRDDVVVVEDAVENVRGGMRRVLELQWLDVEVEGSKYSETATFFIFHLELLKPFKNRCNLLRKLLVYLVRE
jgi:hypothetical protein